MQISEVMKRTGLSRKAIYFYEEKGLLTPGKISAGEQREYRFYSEEDISRLQMIAKLRMLDVSVTDIERIFSGVKADIVLQNHLKKQQEAIGELIRNMEMVNRLLVALPPNASQEALDAELGTIEPMPARSELHDIDELFTAGYTRRISMLLFEAFIDRPFDSEERWEMWYSLLEQMEASLTPEILDGYRDYYGSLATDELCRDYDLRRKMICGYIDYTGKEEEEKAKEIFAELRALLTDEKAFRQWNDYYSRLVDPWCVTKSTMEIVSGLSEVYDRYQERFTSMLNRYLMPLLEQLDGKLIRDILREKMGNRDMFTHYGLNFFDFYNCTIRRILREKETGVK